MSSRCTPADLYHLLAGGLEPWRASSHESVQAFRACDKRELELGPADPEGKTKGENRSPRFRSICDLSALLMPSSNGGLTKPVEDPVPHTPRLGSPVPQLTPAPSAPGPGSPCHICTGTGLTPATSHQKWAHPCHVCTGTCPFSTGKAYPAVSCYGVSHKSGRYFGPQANKQTSTKPRSQPDCCVAPPRSTQNRPLRTRAPRANKRTLEKKPTSAPGLGPLCAGDN